MNNLTLLPYSTACCSVEWVNATCGIHDVTSPKDANLLLILGPVTVQHAENLKAMYKNMRTPKWVIAVGACATSGGLYNNYNILSGIDQIIPVDVFVPGCPPRPEQILNAINMLHEKNT